MFAARNTPSSNLFMWSSRPWITSVGAVIWGRRSTASAVRRAFRARSDTSADVDIRWSSSSQRICSSLAPGIIWNVNTRRNSGVGRSQPTFVSWSSAATISRSSGVASRYAAA